MGENGKGPEQSGKKKPHFLRVSTGLNGDSDLEATEASVGVEAFAIALEAGNWDGLITGGVEGVIPDGFYGGGDGRDVSSAECAGKVLTSPPQK